MAELNFWIPPISNYKSMAFKDWWIFTWQRSVRVIKDDTTFLSEAISSPGINAVKKIILRTVMQSECHQVSKLLSRPLDTEHAWKIYKDYSLRQGQVYRIKAKILQWVVLQEIWFQLVRASHDDLNYFAVKKNLQVLLFSPDVS